MQEITNFIRPPSRLRKQGGLIQRTLSSGLFVLLLISGREELPVLMMELTSGRMLRIFEMPVL